MKFIEAEMYIRLVYYFFSHGFNPSVLASGALGNIGFVEEYVFEYLKKYILLSLDLCYLVKSSRMEEFMARNFTDYSKVSENTSKIDEASSQEKDKVIKKLRKKVKKQRKLIHKLSKCRKVSEDCSTSKCNLNDGDKSDRSREKSFFTEVKEKFIKAVPSICRTVAKAATTILCGWVLNCFGKRKVA